MPEHVLISCKQCQRELRVRVEYLGQMVVCNHCGQLFVAEARTDAAFESTAVASPTSGRFAASLPAEPPITSAVLDPELAQLRGEVLRLKAENDRLTSRFINVNYQRVALQVRAENLESRLQQALAHIRLVQDDLAACEADRSELNRLRVEAFALREKALHALNLEEELDTLRQQAEELASIRRERDDLVQALQQTRRELEAFKNRRLDETEAQRSRERAPLSTLKRNETAGQPFVP